MFTRKPKPEPTGLDKVLNSLMLELDTMNADSTEYAAMADQLQKLYPLRQHDPVKPKVSPDTLALITANLLGIAIIVGHERANVVTSKALSFLTKLK